MRVGEARLIEALRRAFCADKKTPTMVAWYLRERYPDVWEYIREEENR